MLKWLLALATVLATPCVYSQGLSTLEYTKFTTDSSSNVVIRMTLGAGTPLGTLPGHINDREKQKFTTDASSNVVIRAVFPDGIDTTSGLQTVLENGHLAPTNDVTINDLTVATVSATNLHATSITGSTVNVTTLTAADLIYPGADGSDGQVVQTDGAGNLSFVSRPYIFGGSDPVPTNSGPLQFLPFDVVSQNVDLKTFEHFMMEGIYGFSLATQFKTNRFENHTVIADLSATTTFSSNSLAGLVLTNQYRLLIIGTNTTSSSTQHVFWVQGDYNP